MSETRFRGEQAAAGIRIDEHVRRLEDEHPPLDPAAVDFSVRRPGLLLQRYGRVLDYMARTELEVERNVLELATLLPDPPERDRYFYAEVWQPQEARHGQILDELQVRLGRDPVEADLTSVSPKIRVVGAVAHLPSLQDVVRMLYYLTGMTTERSALLAYHALHDGVTELGERAVAETIVSPIRRQEPGHYAYYQMSARALWSQLAPWQQWLVRRLRQDSFAPVGATNDEQHADVGDMMIALGMSGAAVIDSFAEQVSRVERDLLWSQHSGLRVPPYVARAFRDAVDRAEQRQAAAA